MDKLGPPDSVFLTSYSHLLGISTNIINKTRWETGFIYFHFTKKFRLKLSCLQNYRTLRGQKKKIMSIWDPQSTSY